MSPRLQVQPTDIKHQQKIVREAFYCRKLPYSVGKCAFFFLLPEILYILAQVPSIYTGKNHLKTFCVNSSFMSIEGV